MIRSVRLQNYASFGDMQTAQLEPITVVVGANNSGKTNFLRFVDVIKANPTDFSPYWHRTPRGDGQMRIEWTAEFTSEFQSELEDTKPTIATYALAVARQPGKPQVLAEQAVVDRRKAYFLRGPIGGQATPEVDESHVAKTEVRLTLHKFASRYPDHSRTPDFRALVSPIHNARHVHLRVETLRQDERVQPDPTLQADGTGLAPVLAHWLLEHPHKAERFNAIMKTCLPEMERVHARCVAEGTVRAHFEQRDRERFDARQVSDGVLVFAGLIAHALEAPPNSLVMLEEPERGIHPRRLAELVDLLRTLVHERGTQFILATHSPALLNQFKDDPEAILTFRRSSAGTLIKRLSDDPEWVDTLSKADPGQMLMGGVFNEGT